MFFYHYLHDHLGYLGWPLLLCSVITMALLLEKVVILALQTARKQLVEKNALEYQSLLQPVLAAKGINLLCAHRHENKVMREEIAAIWLRSQRHKLSSGIRILQIIALLTPLLGLLGTVLGLIQVFGSLADHRGPIEPSLLADGLGLAMYTTAAGLTIALPALAGAHGFQLWIDHLFHNTEQRMNQVNLMMEGVDMEKYHDQ
jgi:biopolymer transport protein ExbB